MMKKIFIIPLTILSTAAFVNAQNITVTIDDGTGVFYVRNDVPDTLMVVNGGTGNVGIGTKEPQEKLQIHGDLIVHETAESLRGANIMAADIDGNKVNLFAQDGHGYLKTTATEMDLNLGAGSWGDHLTIKSDGKVGIGTDSPDEKLQVAGNMRLDGALEDKDGEAGTAGQILSSTATGTNWIAVPSGADNLGNHIATQNIRLNNNWLSSDGDNEGLFVDNNGNVGIGTDSPTEKLDVVGNIAVSGTVDGIDIATDVAANTAKVTDDDDGVAEVYGAGWDADGEAPTKNDVYDKIESLPGGHDAVTLNANATAAGLSLSNQEINYRAATNAQTGYMTAALVTNIETNNAKVTNATHTGDVAGATTLTIGNDKVLESHLKSVNTPTDEYALTYEATTGDFEWQTFPSGADNLGNHTSTQDLDMAGFEVNLNGGWLSGDGNDEGVYVDSDGDVGIGLASPVARLHVSGDDGFLAQGTYGNGVTQNLGGGTRLHFYPKKAAFRVGHITGNQWNDGNIGNYSVAMGYNTTAIGNYSTSMGTSTAASGDFSTAMGISTTASATYSTAMGSSTTASANYSTAMGFSTTASGNSSTAMGNQTTANGDYSTAMGNQTTANGDYSTAMGYNTTVIGNYSTSMGTSTTASGNYSTAMGRGITASGDYSVAIALKDKTGTDVTQAMTMAIMGGKVGIGTVTPGSKLSIKGLDVYADNAAALVGGLVAGDLYRSGDLLKIVH